MIKFFTLFTAFTIMVNTSNAAFNENQEEKKNFPTSSPAFGSTIAGMFTELTRQDLERLTGRHLTLKERIAFTLLKLNTRHQQKREQTKGFNATGFLIGFLATIPGVFLGALGLYAFGLLGLLALICTLIFSKNKNLQKWAFIGWLTAVVIVYVVLIIGLSNYG